MYVYMEFQNFIYNITRTRAKVSPISCARNLHLGSDIFVARYAEASFFPDADGGRVGFFLPEERPLPLPMKPRRGSASPKEIVEAQRDPNLELLSPGRFVTHGSGSVSYDPRADALLEGRETYSWGCDEEERKY